MKASEWNMMALVDGRRTINEICDVSPMRREETLNRLAQLKLAGIITATEREPREAESSNLEVMVNRLSSLLESYLTEKESSRAAGSRIVTLEGEQE
jgi:hypothetical protein